MKSFTFYYNYLRFSYLFLLFGLSSCTQFQIRPMYSLNSSIFEASISYREPVLGDQWLVNLANRSGKEKIQLINMRSRSVVALPGINRSDSQPISISVSANGERIAFIRQRADQTELLLYRRNLGTLQRIDISPKGVPRRVSLDGSGKILAVQISRGGRWDVDIIRL